MAGYTSFSSLGDGTEPEAGLQEAKERTDNRVKRLVYVVCSFRSVVTTVKRGVGELAVRRASKALF